MREAKWWKDPKKDLYRSLQKLAIAPKHDAYSHKPTDEETLRSMNRVIKDYVPEYLSASTGLVYNTLNYSQSDGTVDAYKTIGNQGTDPNEFIVWEIEMQSKDDWKNLFWAGNVPLEAASITTQKRGKFTATIAMGAGMHMVFITPPGAKVGAYYVSL